MLSFLPLFFSSLSLCDARDDAQSSDAAGKAVTRWAVAPDGEFKVVGDLSSGMCNRESLSLPKCVSAMRSHLAAKKKKKKTRKKNPPKNHS